MPFQTSLKIIIKPKHVARGNVTCYLLTIIKVALTVCKHYLFTDFHDSWYECYGPGKNLIN